MEWEDDEGSCFLNDKNQHLWKVPGWQPCREQSTRRLATNQPRTLSAGPLRAAKGEITVKPWPPRPGCQRGQSSVPSVGLGFLTLTLGAVWRLPSFRVARQLSDGNSFWSAPGWTAFSPERGTYLRSQQDSLPSDYKTSKILRLTRVPFSSIWIIKLLWLTAAYCSLLIKRAELCTCLDFLLQNGRFWPSWISFEVILFTEPLFISVICFKHIFHRKEKKNAPTAGPFNPNLTV